MTSSLPLFLFLFLGLATNVIPYSGGEGNSNDAFLRQMIERMGNDLVDYSDVLSPGMSPISPGIISRGMPATETAMGYPDDFALSPSLRDREYLSHSSLFSNRLQDPYGDPSESLAEETTSTADIKTDGVLPAYCNPPNPCPFGYTSKDGCLEEFENTAAFSRSYQSVQECMCDTEHMFNCPDSTSKTRLDALARSFQASSIDAIMEGLEKMGHTRLVAKKFSKSSQMPNPFLEGDKLSIAAKKGGQWKM